MHGNFDRLRSRRKLDDSPTVHEIILRRVIAANALRLAGFPEEPLDESNDEDFAWFNEARSFRQH